MPMHQEELSNQIRRLSNAIRCGQTSDYQPPLRVSHRILAVTLGPNLLSDWISENGNSIGLRMNQPCDLLLWYHFSDFIAMIVIHSAIDSVWSWVAQTTNQKSTALFGNRTLIERTTAIETFLQMISNGLIVFKLFPGSQSLYGSCNEKIHYCNKRLL